MGLYAVSNDVLGAFPKQRNSRIRPVIYLMIGGLEFMFRCGDAGRYN